MQKIDFKSAKLKLEYPCEWTYKVVGNSEEVIRKAVKEVVKKKKYAISLSNTSSKGKYHCLNVDMIIESEEERTLYFTALKENPDIIMVL